jgi:hypothetical protein
MRKIMPKASKNPEFLYNILEAQTRALAKILEGQKLAKEKHLEYDAETAELHAAESLRPLLQALSPQYRVLNRILASGSTKAMALLFEIHGVEAYRNALEYPQQNKVSLGDLIKRPNLDLLKMIHNAGIDLAAYDTKMLAQAVRHRNLDYLSFVRNDVGSQKPILRCAQQDTVFDRIWLPVVDEIADELRRFIPIKTSSVYQDLIKSLYSTDKTSYLRKFAILLHLSPDDIADSLESQNVVIKFPGLQHLLELSRSNHGKLTLLQMEPDLKSIITRQSNMPFYGISQSDIKAFYEQSPA